MDRLLLVLCEYAQAVNPEPGVARAPTPGEQLRALGRRAVQLGGEPDEQVVLVPAGGLAAVRAELSAAVRRSDITGVVLFTIGALSDERGVDLEVLAELWRHSTLIDIFVEHLTVSDEGAYAALVEHLLVTNQVRARERVEEWSEVVQQMALEAILP